MTTQKLNKRVLVSSLLIVCILLSTLLGSIISVYAVEGSKVITIIRPDPNKTVSSPFWKVAWTENNNATAYSITAKDLASGNSLDTPVVSVTGNQRYASLEEIGTKSNVELTIIGIQNNKEVGKYVYSFNVQDIIKKMGSGLTYDVTLTNVGGSNYTGDETSNTQFGDTEYKPSFFEQALSTVFIALADGINFLIGGNRQGGFGLDQLIFRAKLDRSSLFGMAGKYYTIFGYLVNPFFVISLMWIGLQLMLSDLVVKKIQAKDALLGFVTGYMLMFFMPYIFDILFFINNGIVDAFYGVTTGNGGFVDTFHQQALSQRALVDAIMYLSVTIMTLWLAFVYIIRLLTLTFLYMLSPVFAWCYGNSGTRHLTSTWFKEVFANIFVQATHAFTFSVVVTVATNVGSVQGAYLSISPWIWKLVSLWVVIPSTNYLRGMLQLNAGGAANSMAGMGAMMGAFALARGMGGALRTGGSEIFGGVKEGFGALTSKGKATSNEEIAKENKENANSGSDTLVSEKLARSRKALGGITRGLGRIGGSVGGAVLGGAIMMPLGRNFALGGAVLGQAIGQGAGALGGEAVAGMATTAGLIGYASTTGAFDIENAVHADGTPIMNDILKSDPLVAKDMENAHAIANLTTAMFGKNAGMGAEKFYKDYFAKSPVSPNMEGMSGLKKGDTFKQYADANKSIYYQEVKDADGKVVGTKVLGMGKGISGMPSEGMVRDLKMEYTDGKLSPVTIPKSVIDEATFNSTAMANESVGNIAEMRDNYNNIYEGEFQSARTAYVNDSSNWSKIIPKEAYGSMVKQAEEVKGIQYNQIMNNPELVNQRFNEIKNEQMRNGSYQTFMQSEGLTEAQYDAKYIHPQAVESVQYIANEKSQEVYDRSLARSATSYIDSNNVSLPSYVETQFKNNARQSAELQTGFSAKEKAWTTVYNNGFNSAINGYKRTMELQRDTFNASSQILSDWQGFDSSVYNIPAHVVGNVATASMASSLPSYSSISEVLNHQNRVNSPDFVQAPLIQVNPINPDYIMANGSLQFKAGDAGYYMASESATVMYQVKQTGEHIMIGVGAGDPTIPYGEVQKKDYVIDGNITPYIEREAKIVDSAIMPMEFKDTTIATAPVTKPIREVARELPVDTVILQYHMGNETRYITTDGNYLGSEMNLAKETGINVLKINTGDTSQLRVVEQHSNPSPREHMFLSGAINAYMSKLRDKADTKFDFATKTERQTIFDYSSFNLNPDELFK